MNAPAMESVAFSFDVIKGWARARRNPAGFSYVDAGERRVRELIRKAWIDAGGHTEPLSADCPVTVHVVVHKRLQTSAPKCVVARRDTTKPDVDNVGKLVMDALTGLAYVDDKQVVSLHVDRDWRRRRWSDRTDVTVAWPGGWTPDQNEIRDQEGAHVPMTRGRDREEPEG